MKEFQKRKIEEALKREDYRALSSICLEVLQASDWHEAWEKMAALVEKSGEYVLAKFMASAYALFEKHDVLSPAAREFIARDVVVCIEKTLQVIESLSRQEDSASIHRQLGV